MNGSTKRASSKPLASTMEARAILAQYYGKPKRHKYRAEPTFVDGIRFASKREAVRYGELKLLQQFGRIEGLELQPQFPLHSVNLVTGELVKVGTYIADFRYRLCEPDVAAGTIRIEDSKGFSTPTYRLKRKMVEAEYGVEITEV